MNLKAQLERVEQQARKREAALDAEIIRLLLEAVKRWERKHGPATPVEAPNVQFLREWEGPIDAAFIAEAKGWLILDGSYP